MKRVLIVGAGAVGRACAARFAREDASIAVADVSEDAVAAVREACNDRIVASVCIDLAAENAGGEIRTLVEKLGGVDTALFAAGLGWYGDPLQEDARDLTTLLRSSVLGFKRFATAVAPSLIERRGMMIVFSGSDARAPERLFELWAVVSACVQASAKCVHDALADKGVRVVNIAVQGVVGGGLDTMMSGLGELVGEDLDVLEKFVAAKRPAPAPSASDVADITVKIADAPLYGATIAVDGGATGRCWP